MAVNDLKTRCIC